MKLENVGKRIKTRRKELQLTAEELGKRIGKDRSTIYRYEKGEIENLPLDILYPLAEALETTADYLTGWEKKEAEERAAFDIMIAKNEDLREMLKMFMALPEDKKKTVKQMVADYYNAFADGR